MGISAHAMTPRVRSHSQLRLSLRQLKNARTGRDARATRVGADRALAKQRLSFGEVGLLEEEFLAVG